MEDLLRPVVPPSREPKSAETPQIRPDTGQQELIPEIKLSTDSTGINQTTWVLKTGSKICNYPDCKKRLILSEQTMICKCEHVFCQIHRSMELHKCTFDYITPAKEALKRANERIVAEKISKI